MKIESITLCAGASRWVFTRMTMDIDFVISAQSLDDVMSIARQLGYTIRGKDLSFRDGTIEIRRISKVDRETGDVLPLDFLLVTPTIQRVWESRINAEWAGGRLSVVTRDGLVELKKLRGSAQDMVDIDRLLGEEDA